MICVLTDGYPTVNKLLDKVCVKDKEVIAQNDIFSCAIDHERFIVVAPTIFGKVSCGTTLGIILSKFDISSVIVCGNCASTNGCTNPIGTVAISTQSQQYDVNYTPLGFPCTVVPGLSSGVYVCANGLVQLAVNTCSRMEYSYSLGKTVSGDRFIANESFTKNLADDFKACFIDTSCGSYGEVCFANDIPFVCVNTVCNYGDDCACKMYSKYSNAASTKSLFVVYEMLKSLLSD